MFNPEGMIFCIFCLLYGCIMFRCW